MDKLIFVSVAVVLALLLVATQAAKAVKSVPDISAVCANYEDLMYYTCDQCCSYEGIDAWEVDKERATKENCVCKRRTHDPVRCRNIVQEDCEQCCVFMNKKPNTGFTFAMDKELAFTGEHKCLCRIHFDDEK